jgi:hypothetical protein
MDLSFLLLCPQILSIQAEGYEGAEASKSVSSSQASPLLKMCAYTFYRYNCGHQASLREEGVRNYFLTEPCVTWPEEGEYCRQRTHHCIYLPFPCPECGGPQDPRSRPSELEESKTLIWHIQDREVQMVFGEVNWAGPRKDVQEAPSVSPML